jgi:hypothetical protein
MAGKEKHKQAKQQIGQEEPESVNPREVCHGKKKEISHGGEFSNKTTSVNKLSGSHHVTSLPSGKYGWFVGFIGPGAEASVDDLAHFRKNAVLPFIRLDLAAKISIISHNRRKQI